MGFLKDSYLMLRQARRVGAFAQARKHGMSNAQARAYSNGLYPPTAADIAYQGKCWRDRELKRAGDIHTEARQDPTQLNNGKIKDETTIAAKIADNCFRLSLSDGCWQTFGFPRLPSRSWISQRLKPAWKASLENRILHTLPVLFAAAHLVGLEENRQEVFEELIQYFWGDDNRMARIHASQESLRTAINEYLSLPSGEWHTALLSHLKPMSVPEKKRQARLMVGCVHVAMTAQNIKLLMDMYGIEMERWQSTTIDEFIREQLSDHETSSVHA
jgi:hypothetical protein